MGVGGSHPARHMFCPKVTPLLIFCTHGKTGFRQRFHPKHRVVTCGGGLMPAKTEYGGGTTPLPFGKKSGVWGWHGWGEVSIGTPVRHQVPEGATDVKCANRDG
jgi:hypothetical protein